MGLTTCFHQEEKSKGSIGTMERQPVSIRRRSPRVPSEQWKDNLFPSGGEVQGF